MCDFSYYVFALLKHTNDITNEWRFQDSRPL